MVNQRQGILVCEVIHRVTDPRAKPLQIFTGPAGCVKTFTLRLVMDVYNRYCRNRTINYGDGKDNSAVNAYTLRAQRRARQRLRSTARRSTQPSKLS